MTNPDSELLEVNAVAYHEDDRFTFCYLQIVNENLLYRRPDTTSAFYAEVRVSYRLYLQQDPKRMVDSGSVYLTDRSTDEHVKVRSIRSGISLACEYPNDYKLDLAVLDKNKKITYHKSVNIYKHSRHSAQNFLVRVRDTIVFRNTFFGREEVAVKISSAAIRQVTVDCFVKDFGPALPPFSTKVADELKYKPDSTFVLQVNTNQLRIVTPEKGFYHIRSNPGESEGLTLYAFDPTFPGVSNSEEMISCTRYLMYKEEFDRCKQSEDKKAAIDDFWLKIGGSNERARELLKRYYGRVKEANKNFTSYTEGWKTDRGMIFIVLGPPANMYRNKKEETWIYGNEATPNALRFVFNKTENPFSDNDYVLERSQFYKESYYTAVEYWRQGLIYNDPRR